METTSKLVKTNKVCSREEICKTNLVTLEGANNNKVVILCTESENINVFKGTVVYSDLFGFPLGNNGSFSRRAFVHYHDGVLLESK